MARIPLRSYINEIERLIENNRIDEAVAHCRHILQHYPRYIEVYRLLGKAFLEVQRYSDAADIFQRVLSSVPEDYVSHVGMSIIREDEGNLDEAIWHMERAFESQPSNSTIQDELRRLYGRRDGVEPPKIRLTRGALARMYVKGDLNQEAVTELRTALGEDPNRLDLRVLLTRALFSLGQKVETAEIASQVLRKLPNSLDANRIMAELLSGTERESEAQVYRNIVIGLDPYFQFITPTAPNPEQVPDQAVSIERLEWKAGQPPPGADQQPGWATSLGIQLEQAPSANEALPEWMNAERQEIQSDDVFKTTPLHEEHAEGTTIPLSETPETTFDEFEADDLFGRSEGQPHDDEGELPDWMKEAGWSSHEAEDLDTGATLEQVSQGGDVEIPDWLENEAVVPADVAPLVDLEPSTESTAAEKAPKGDEEAKEILFGELEEEAQQDLQPELVGEAEDQEKLPEWLFEEETPAASETELPPWLSESSFESPEIEQSSSSIQPEPEGDLPEWLFEEEKDIPDKHPGSTPEKEIPEWLMGESSKSDSGQGDELTEVEKPSQEIPDWLFDEEILEGELSSQMPETITGEAKISDETEAEAPSSKSDTTIKLPSWLLESAEATEKSLDPSMPLEMDKALSDDLILQGLEAESQQLTASEEGTPSWLLDDDLEPVEIQPEAGFQAEITQERDSPTQIADLEELPVTEEDTQPSKIIKDDQIEPGEAQISAGTPEIISEDLEPLAQSGVSTGQPASGLEETVIEGELLDDEAAFAWLEGLAAKQGADEALIHEPEDRSETPPKWIQETIEKGEEIVAEFPPMKSLGAEEIQLPESSETLIETGFSESAPEPTAAEYEPVSEAGADEISPASEVLEGEPHQLKEIAETIARSEIEAFGDQRPGISGDWQIEEEIPTLEGAGEQVTAEVGASTGTEELAKEKEPSEVPDLPDWLSEPFSEPTDEYDWSPPADKELELVNLNNASLVELERLPGIGFIKAQQILNFRDTHGPFSKVEDLLDLPEISPEIFTDVKDRVFVEEAMVEPVETEAFKASLEVDEEPPEALYSARQALKQDDPDLALNQYIALIETNQHLDYVIEDLQLAAGRFPDNYLVWQSLGDAYLRQDRVQEALNAYLVAEQKLA